MRTTHSQHLNSLIQSIHSAHINFSPSESFIFVIIIVIVIVIVIDRDSLLARVSDDEAWYVWKIS